MILVSRTNYTDCIEALRGNRYLAIDTETTGKYPFLGDRIFSIIIADDKEEYYFNWNEYPALPGDLLLGPEHKEGLKLLFNNAATKWFMHKAIFDLPMLAMDGFELVGQIHCTVVGERVAYNEYNDYTLEGCGLRIKYPKDMTVENYIKQHKLYTHKEYNGFKEKSKRFDLVPYQIITKYGCRDARVCYALGKHQIEKIRQRDQRQPTKQTIKDCYNNEVRLQKTLHKIQMRGARVNQEYCREAIEYFHTEMDGSQTEFRSLTGHDFVLSGKLFAEIFQDEKGKWKYTDKGNPSFDGDVLKTFENPAAKQVVRYKEAKSKIDFFKNFIKFSDAEGFIHTEFKAYGTRTGRFSSAAPNLQNLEKAKGDDLNAPFVVRRAFVPRDGFFFAMIDYDQIEYRMMLDYANAHELIDKVLGGLDVHTATAEVAGVSRDQAKTVNFGTLYGQGINKLAGSLGVTPRRAKEIQSSIFDAAPEIRAFIRKVIRTAEDRGNITNWLGRVSYFPKRNLCYKAPNTLMQGGAGDVCKVAMVKIDEYLTKQAARSRLLLNIHDELVLEMHYSEAHLLYDIKEIMESVYPHRRLPLTCGIEWSPKSLADKQDFTGIDCVNETARDQVQGEDIPTASQFAENVGQEDAVSGASRHP